jgi:heme exporter protein B
MIRKDLLSEYRARRVWPAMLLLGILVALVFTLQMDLLPGQQRRIAGGLLWLAVFFAGILALDRSFALEGEDGCGEGLLLYPLSPTLVYLAKLVVNVLALAALELILIPVFIVLSGVPLWTHPGLLLLVAALGNLGIAAVGTPLSALAAKIPRGAHLSALLIFPMVIPVVLAASEATRLIAEDDFGAEGWRWIQFLAAFAVVFVVAGIALFDFLVED